MTRIHAQSGSRLPVFGVARFDGNTAPPAHKAPHKKITHAERPHATTKERSSQKTLVPHSHHRLTFLRASLPWR